MTWRGAVKRRQCKKANGKENKIKEKKHLASGKEKHTCRRRRPRQFIHTFRMRVRSCYIFRFLYIYTQYTRIHFSQFFFSTLGLTTASAAFSTRQWKNILFTCTPPVLHTLHNGTRKSSNIIMYAVVPWVVVATILRFSDFFLCLSRSAPSCVRSFFFFLNIFFPHRRALW